MPVTHEIRPDGKRSKCGKRLTATLLIGEVVECKACLSKPDRWFKYNFDKVKPPKMIHLDRGDGKTACGQRIWNMVTVGDIFTCHFCDTVKIMGTKNGL